jgi:hypothetical protein
LAIFLSLVVTACGGVVREEGAGGTKAMSNSDDPARGTLAGSSGGTPADGTGGSRSSNGGPSLGVTIPAGGATNTGGLVGTGALFDAGRVSVDRGIAGRSGSIGDDAEVDAGEPSASQYVCSERTLKDPGGTGKGNESCCHGEGLCLPKPNVTNEILSSYGHDTCDPFLVCALAPPTSPPQTCTTTAMTSDPKGLEGRCIPSCILAGNPLAPFFDAGKPTCPTGTVCAPCYNPVAALSTGICTLALDDGGRDAPVTSPPAPYRTCPEADAGAAPYAGGGVCVPGAMANSLSVPSNPLYYPLTANLRQDNCATGEKCVPRAKAADPRQCATPCKTSKQLAGIGYSAGACVPAYVVFDVNGSAGVVITQNADGSPTGCGRDELCYPCNDPLRPGQPTGACY